MSPKRYSSFSPLQRCNNFLKLTSILPYYNISSNFLSISVLIYGIILHGRYFTGDHAPILISCLISYMWPIFLWCFAKISLLLLGKFETLHFSAELKLLVWDRIKRCFDFILWLSMTLSDITTFPLLIIIYLNCQ